MRIIRLCEERSDAAICSLKSRAGPCVQPLISRMLMTRREQAPSVRPTASWHLWGFFRYFRYFRFFLIAPDGNLSVKTLFVNVRGLYLLVDYSTYVLFCKLFIQVTRSGRLCPEVSGRFMVSRAIVLQYFGKSFPNPFFTNLI